MLHVVTAGQTLSAALNAKTFRRVRSTIREHGPEKIAAVLLQGRLEGTRITEAGINAQVKTPPKAEAEGEAAAPT
ncbi:MAG: hypothetical protein ACJ8AW_19275 [Rhodopila sp.]